MDQEILKQTVAANLTRYRKISKLTQAELAEKINYSDKAVSKWERGDGLPDAAVLCEIAEIFGVTVNDLVYRSGPTKIPAPRASKIVVGLLSVGLVWLVATIVFVALRIILPWFTWSWLAFIYALPASAIVLTVFSAVWKKRIMLFLSESAIVWMTILSFVLSLSFFPNMPLLFILGAPLEIMAIIWFFRPSLRK